MADYKPIQEGDELSSSTLDIKFDSLEGAANNVSAVSRRTFDHYHGTHSLVEPNIAFHTGARFMGHAANPLPEHDRLLDPVHAYKHHYTYRGLGNASWPGPGISRLSPGNTGTGWRVIGDTLSDPTYGQDTVQGRPGDAKLECTFGREGKATLSLSEPGESPTLGGVGGVLVLFNVEVLFFHNEAGQPMTAGMPFLGGFDWVKFRARLMLQVKVQKLDGTDLGWLNLKKSHRALSMPSSGASEDGSTRSGGYEFKASGLATSHHSTVRGAMWKDISIRILITNDDLNSAGLDYGVAGTALEPGRLRLQGVRAVISLEIPGVSPTHTPDLTDNTVAHSGIALKAYSMTTLILSSEFKV